MKKVLSVLLALCLLVGAAPMFALAADDDFVIEDGVLVEYNGPGGDVVIPNGVKSIGVETFWGNKDIISVTLPKSMESSGIFRGCENLEKIALHDSLKRLDYYAFTGCFSLKEIVIPESVTEIGWDVFENCKKLKTIVIPKNVKVINPTTFAGCSGLTAIYLPAGLEKISYGATSGCTSLKDVYFAGTEEQWKSIPKENKDGDNDPLFNATMHYNYTGNTDPTPSTDFTDVKSTDYFADAVNWAVESGITAGTGGGKFSPGKTCTRDQIVTFLYRANGSPEVTVTDQFADMPKSEEFRRAISWAVEKDVTSGTGGGKFSPGKGCTRAQAVTFIWRAAGKPEPENVAAFSDMPSNSDFQKAISWASENGITSGIGGNKFGPDRTCTRGQIVTFLYNAKDL